MKNTKVLTTMAVLVAMGTIGAQLLWFPAGIAKAYPVQHAVNVIAAVVLGPVPAVTIAFVIGMLRFLLGLGTILAFPGGMFGALLAGICYRIYEKKRSAVIGEVLGTGVIGAFVSVPIAHALMGSGAGALTFLPSFLVSSVSGALIASFILSRVKKENMILQP